MTDYQLIANQINLVEVAAPLVDSGNPHRVERRTSEMLEGYLERFEEEITADTRVVEEKLSFNPLHLLMLGIMELDARYHNTLDSLQKQYPVVLSTDWMFSNYEDWPMVGSVYFFGDNHVGRMDIGSVLTIGEHGAAYGLRDIRASASGIEENVGHVINSLIQENASRQLFSHRLGKEIDLLAAERAITPPSAYLTIQGQLDTLEVPERHEKNVAYLKAWEAKKSPRELHGALQNLLSAGARDYPLAMKFALQDGRILAAGVEWTNITNQGAAVLNDPTVLIHEAGSPLVFDRRRR